MHRHFFSLRIALLVIALGIVFGWLWTEATGRVVVHDPDVRIAGAALVDGGGRRHPMRQLTDHHWVAAPRDGFRVELTCRSGLRVWPSDAAVTAGAETTVAVEASTCARR